MKPIPIRSGRLEAPHGFFTRVGGVSPGIYASLNGGQGSGDDRRNVAENRWRVASALNVTPENLVSVYQVHGDTALHVEGPWRGERQQADGMVTDRPGVALAILTADCAPILFEDLKAGVVGACHAGWKGAFAGIIGATVAAMVRLGAERGRISAVVGPTISQRNYEVGPEFVEQFIDEDPDLSRFFAGGEGDRAMFDLPGFCLARLREEEVEAEWTGHCTYDDAERFYSYRRATHREEPDYGRLVSAIALPPGA